VICPSASALPLAVARDLGERIAAWDSQRARTTTTSTSSRGRRTWPNATEPTAAQSRRIVGARELW